MNSIVKQSSSLNVLHQMRKKNQHQKITILDEVLYTGYKHEHISINCRNIQDQPPKSCQITEWQTSAPTFQNANGLG